MPKYQEQVLLVQRFVVLKSEEFSDFIDQCEVILPWMVKDGVLFKNIEMMPDQERLSS